MKLEWLILIVSALTDFVINAGTSLMAAMVATGSASMPSKAVIILSVVGGLVAMSRTIQSALKTSPATTAVLRGDPPPIPVLVDPIKSETVTVK